MLISARNISKSHGLKSLFTRINFALDAGDRIGLIGPNGAGKSTLLKILAGLESIDEGDLSRTKNLKVAFVSQSDDFADLEALPAIDIVAKAGEAALDPHDHDHHEAHILAQTILSTLGFDQPGAPSQDSPASSLSGGWRKRLNIARALASCSGEPDVLMLDEPTNHLDVPGIDWLEELLTSPLSIAGSRKVCTCVLVTHDRAFLERVATKVVELSDAFAQGTFAAQGNYTEFLRRKQEFLEGQARQEQALANQVRKDLAWLARGPQARRTKSQSRIDSSHQRIDALEDLKDRNTAATTLGARVDFVSTGRRTRKFINAKGLASAPARAVNPTAPLLFRELDIELGAGDVLGLLGPNGSGKTTLLRILTRQFDPDEGTVKFSDPPPRLAIFSQHRADIDPLLTLGEALCPVGDQVRFNDQTMHITAWSRRFLFRDDQLLQSIRSLSGGELARVHIARLMLLPADVLVLDEPTNDLDIPTLEVLEEAIESFAGGVILVTHDRAMLERLAQRLIVLDGHGGSRIVAGVDQALRVLRASGQAAPPKPASKTTESSRSEARADSAAVSTASAPARKKLSYNEQREYENLEAEILDAEEQAKLADHGMNDPEVQRDHQRMASACQVADEAHALVAKLYARWEELEAKLR